MQGRRVVIEKAGDYSELQLLNFETPQISDNQVLIEVKFAGVNYADCLVRFGVYASAKEYVGWPITPGFEVSGKILKVGKKITQFSIGEEVIGFTRFNGYSSHVVVDENQVFHLPKEMNLSEGAAFPAVFFTAYYALIQSFRLYPKSKILVHSAAGGVGSALVQLAKAKGYQVAGVIGSNRKSEYLKSLGCDWIYDKSEKNFDWKQIHDQHPDGFHAVFDANGYTTLKISYDLLRPTGKLVVYGAHSLLPRGGGRLNYFKAAWGIIQTPKFNPMQMITDNKNLICFNLSFLFGEKEMISEAMGDLLELLKSKRLTPPKVTEFPIEQVAKAHELIESGQSTGKIVLKF